MDELLEWMDYIEDKRQQTKVRHKLKDIIVIVLFATLANVDDWVEMEYFAHYHEAYLKKYIELKNGIPSHDTLCRVFGMLSPEILQQLYGKWQELLNQNEGEVLRKLICIDGKTMRSNKRKEGKPNHIITAWSKEDAAGPRPTNGKASVWIFPCSSPQPPATCLRHPPNAVPPTCRGSTPFPPHPNTLPENNAAMRAGEQSDESFVVAFLLQLF